MLLSLTKIKNKEFLSLNIPYDTQLISKAKELGGRWNPDKKLWLFPNTAQVKTKLEETFNQKAPEKGNPGRIPTEYLELLERRRYSQNTIQTYTSLFEQFLKYFPHILPQELTDKHVADFQTYLVRDKKSVCF